MTRPNTKARLGCTEIPSLGNIFGLWVHARAVAQHAGLDFAMVQPERRSCRGDSVVSVMPQTALFGVGGQVVGGRNLTAARAEACAPKQPAWYHLSSSWLRFAPRLRAELRASLSAWARRSSFPPFDDFAIHVRCGDTLALGGSRCIDSARESA